MTNKTIHYCWFGGSELPDDGVRCVESWRRYFPDFQVKEWNDGNYDVNKNDFIKQAYQNKKYAFVSDFARMEVIFDYGGIYFDTDVEIVRRLDEAYLNNGFMVFGRNYRGDLGVNSGLGFGADKGNPLIGEILKGYENKQFLKSDGSLLLEPCIILENKILIKNGLKLSDESQQVCGISVLPTQFCADYRKKLTSQTYAIHYGNGSWVSEEDRERLMLKRRLLPVFWKAAPFAAAVIVYTKHYGVFGMIKRIYKKIREKLV
jgi:mannosyltransferase OCH1-like enzyme